MNIALCVGITATAVIWMGPQPGAGYLARVGPAPLRFQPPPKNLSELGPLPPLAMSDPEPAPVENLKPPIETNAPPVVETTETPAPVPVAPQVGPAEPAWTPQMFVQFFNERNGTNHDFNVVLPYSFMPPATTIPAPPSRATYVVK
jgi:hypothetical protein